MRRNRFGLLGSVSVLLVSMVLAACQPVPPGADSYVALVPRTLQAGQTAAVSVSLWNAAQPGRDRVQVSLLRDGKPAVTASKTVSGRGQIEIRVPEATDGEYVLEVKGTSFTDRAQVKVEDSFPVFLETDKPIYKPGQTVHIRALSLDSELKPLKRSLTVEAQDAKGTKVFKKEVETDEYGMASLDLPLSTEPNLGVWKLSASAGKQSAQLDIRVEKYVLPKYEVKVDLPREWFLVSEPIKGSVKAEYSFGKPVKGELEVKALRYVGKWEPFATFTRQIEGDAEFELRPAGFVAGVPGARGMGNVTLEVTVEEKATGYVEKTTRLLTVSNAPLSIQVIPEGSVFKPGLPFSFLVVSESPDNKPLDADVKVTLTYLKKDFQQAGLEEKTVRTERGKALVQVAPPQNSAGLLIAARSGQAHAELQLESSFSPSGNFIHLEQVDQGTLKLGDEARFKVYSTRAASTFYYEVISRGKTVFTSFTRGPQIAFQVTPQMAPSARLLVYQVLPNSEVAADYLPFEVEASYPNQVTVGFSKDEVRPGDKVDLSIVSQGKSKVGIAVVDRSVFILAENRLNLQQVFDELERLYMQPQAELHEVRIYQKIATRGAQDIFREAGVTVLSNKQVPQGEEYQRGRGGPWGPAGGAGPVFFGEEAQLADAMRAAAPAAAATPTPLPASQGLAEVQRVRQFFPETWLWTDVVTDALGRASLSVEAPDTITTWMLHAVAMSRDQGLGIAESQVVAFQPFFLSVDLPYSAIRGEEFPVKVAIYNYLDQAQEVQVEIEPSGWFELLDQDRKTVSIAARDLGGVEFKIRPRGLGVQNTKVTARSTAAADSVIKTIIVAPEGVAREVVDNLILAAGATRTLDTSLPMGIVEGSGRAYLSLTASYLTQTIDGLEALLKMPFGCGEQNMLLFAPDVYISRYLRETGQIKPEIMAKAEMLMITGYQRELTYRRRDGSFSAFGESDQVGSLWLTAFVLKTFAQARDIIYIDESVLGQARAWITSHQKADGSFESVGFVHHQEMMGGLQGKNALTAYVSIALMEAGDKAAGARAAQYLEGALPGIDDPYTAAIVAYALDLAGSARADEAYRKLMEMATEDEAGLHWGGGLDVLPLPEGPGIMSRMPQPKSTGVEATAYATLALLKHGDKLNAGKAARWLVGQRNAYGGYGSTQDTVVALDALTRYAQDARSDVDLKVTVVSGQTRKDLTLNQANFDVLQMVDLAVGGNVEIKAQGKGEAVVQLVRRFNLPDAEKGQDVFRIAVDYDTDKVEVDGVVNVKVSVQFNPPVPIEAGMVVLDVSVPTGFAPVAESLEAVAKAEKKLKRHDVAGRKVIFYIEDMVPGERLSFGFQVKALYPVKAQATASQAYSYYKPEMRGETLSRPVEVLDAAR
ncbi:MAG: alpha-2-macroglobulin [Chloroflexi bacterium]|nr:alpha-2-macroglobulin [Chloroflexota bacterium]